MKESERKKLQGARLAAVRMAAGFKSAREAALENGWTESTYRSHENGTRTIGPDDAEKYAKVYRAKGSQADAARILFGSGREVVDEADDELAPSVSDGTKETVPSSMPAFVTATYGGIVEATAFRPVDDIVDPDRGAQMVPRDERYPRGEYIIFDVVGDSMNAADPPIQAGARVVAIRVDDPYRPIALQTGDIVVVRRVQQQGGLVELSVKELELGETETLYLPRSKSKRHQPIRVRKDLNADDETVVEVLGLVIDVMTKVRRR